MSISVKGSIGSSRVETALKQLGEKAQRLEGLLLLHQCFQEVVVAKQFVTNEPQLVHYDALLARYRECQQVTDLEIIDRDTVKQLLADLSNLIRIDRHQTTRSLDAPLGNDDELGTLGDLVADAVSSVSLENSELRELALDLLSKNSININSTLTNAQLKRAKLVKQILCLLYGLRLTQTEAGLELGCDQATIGRNHNKHIAKLGRKLYLGYHKLPETTQISMEILDEYDKYIVSVCEDYYPTFRTSLFD